MTEYEDRKPAEDKLKIEDGKRRSRRYIRATSKARDARKNGVVGLPEPSAPVTAEVSRPRLQQVPSTRSKMASRNHGNTGKVRQAATATHKVAHARGFTLPVFGSDTFFIYYWPMPRPSSFPAIPDSYRVWKVARDKFEGEHDIDDGADDWVQFAGNVIDYETTERFLFTIAGSFLARAKRAFRAGYSWTAFEQVERAIESDAKAKAMVDRALRAKWMKEMLDNELRLAVFEVIAKRLCNEIWLQEYVACHPSQTKRDSKVEGMSSALHSPELSQLGHCVPSFDEDGKARPQITGWRRDQQLMWQPTYGDETQLPSGLDEARSPSAAANLPLNQAVETKSIPDVHGL